MFSIEEALKEARLMFVFISPNSVNSGWIHFEAGYAYSKNIKVIPVGIDEFDLNILNPPLSLFQGFNVNSEDGLNNLISIINDEFSFSHKPTFSKNEYYQLSLSNGIGAKKNLLHNIDYIGFEIRKIIDPNESTFSRVKGFLTTENFRIGKDYEHQLFLPGMRIDNFSVGNYVTLRVDPLLIKENLSIIKRLYKYLFYEKLDRMNFFLIFNSGVIAITEKYKVAGRLMNTGVKISNEVDSMLELDDLSFSIENTTNRGWRLNISTELDNLEENSILQLVEFLFEKKVLEQSDYYNSWNVNSHVVVS